MKTKIIAVMVTGMAVLFMGAAPNSNHNKKSQNARPNKGGYVCGYYGNYGHGRMMRGAAPDSAYGSAVNCPYARGYSMMNGAVPDSSYRNMTRGSYGRCYGMMGRMGNRMMNGAYGRGYAMMRGMGCGTVNGYYGRGYGMMGSCGYVMMPMMMNMMCGRMMYGSSDSTFVCPYYHNAQPQKQKEGK